MPVYADFRAFRAVSFAALPLLALLASCGGGGGKTVAMDDWVADLCDAAADFDRASDEAGEEFDEADFDDTEAAKEAFANSVEGQRDAQKDFRNAFNDLGKPDIEGSDDVIDAFKQQFDENDELTDEVADAVADIDDDDDFFTAFLDLAADIDEPDFRAKLDDLADDNDEVQDLIDEIDDDEDCSTTIFDSDAPDETDDDVDDEPTQASGNRTPAPAGNDTEAWVGSICTSFTDWVQNIEQANGTFQGKLDSSTGAPAEVKKLLVDFLRFGKQETQDLENDISSLKTPNVKNADRVQDIFAETSGELVGVFDDLIADAQRITVTNPAQTRTEIDALVDTIGVAFDEAGAGFDELDTLDIPEINDLFDSRPECQELE